MSYNERNPTLSFRIERAELKHLEKLAEKKETNVNGIAKKIITKYLKGEIIDAIQDERHWANGMLINPAAFTHYSYAIRDTISSVNIPTVEVHLTDIHNREEFRQISVISPECIDQVIGFGKDSYIKGLEVLIKYLAAL